nr:MAG TPA: hypothetical protein [Caudoviricetes sp.]
MFAGPINCCIFAVTKLRQYYGVSFMWICVYPACNWAC